MNKWLVSLLFGGVFILDGVIIYKINNVQKEIEYFEGEKGYHTRKEHEKALNDYIKKTYGGDK